MEFYKSTSYLGWLHIIITNFRITTQRCKGGKRPISREPISLAWLRVGDTCFFRLYKNAKATWVYYDQRLCYLSWKERLVWSREKIMKQFCVLWKSYACYKKRFSLLPSMCDGKTRNEKLLYKNTKIAILFFHLNYYGSLSLLYMYSIYIYIYCSIIQVFYILWHVVVYVKMISALTENLFLIKNKLFFVPSETPQKILQRSRCRCDRNNEIDPLFLPLKKNLLQCHSFSSY